MNRYDERYIFRRATVEDTDDIMTFIREEWPKKDHVFATHKGFFLYEFRDGEFLNIVIAADRETDVIEGMLGYKPASSNKECFDIWLCMWFIRERGNMPFLGNEIITRLVNIVNPRYSIEVGDNPNTALKLAKVRKKISYKMKHFYKLNKLPFYNIAVVNEYINISNNYAGTMSTLVKIKSIEEIISFLENQPKETVPYKDAKYINNRYLKHPIYDYTAWKVNRGDVLGAVLIAREIDCNNSKVLRIVDFIGDCNYLDGLYNEFEKLIKDSSYEYIDVYLHGIDDVHLENAGFVLRDDTDKNIIPNYFEPFVQSNVDIHCVNDDIKNLRIFKGDCDQDRPNYIPVACVFKEGISGF